MAFVPPGLSLDVRPEQAPQEVRLETQYPAQPILAEQVPARGSLVGWAIAGFSVAGIAGLLVLGYLFLALGPVLLAAGAVLAVIPLVVVMLGVAWIDKWEPEPRVLLIFGFLWGAAVSVAVALLVGLGVEIAAYAAGVSPEVSDVMGSVVQAPIVEEAAKGLGVLLVFLLARRYFDGPVDGVVYAAVVAGGFAFTENIIYFANSMAYSGIISVDATLTFFVRGVMSPFAHAMFTAVIGLFIGLWGRTSTAKGVAGFLVGLPIAMALHALWNASSLLGFIGWIALYVLVQVPLFVGSIVLVTRLRTREQALTRERLAEYAAAGWICVSEVDALGTPAGRSHALTWARSQGLGLQMKAYIRDATNLAFARQRIVTGRDRIGAQRDEHDLLMKLTHSRRAVNAGARTP